MSQVKISGDPSGSGIFTISAPNSSTNRALVLPDNSGTILTTATAGVPVNGPAFSASSTSNQTGISNGVFTKVLFPVEGFDTNNNFASSTFTPTTAGYYQINTGVDFGSGTVVTAFTRVYKNGSSVSFGSGINGGSVSEVYSSASALVYCNGTTDFIEIYGFVSSSSNIFYAGGTFSSFLARSAT